MVNKIKSELKFSYIASIDNCTVQMVRSNTVCMKSKWIQSYAFLGEKFDNFSRIFQDPTLIYMNLPSTKQNVCVESYVLCINTYICRNARRRELENTWTGGQCFVHHRS